MDISRVLNADHIKLNMIASTKEAAIEELTDILVQDGIITHKAEFLRDVWLREEQGATGFENHIAIPHGQSSAVSQTTLIIGRMQNEISWETTDDCYIKCIVLYAICAEEENMERTHLLKKVSTALAYDRVIEKLLNEKKTESIIEIFNMSEEFYDHI